MQLELDRREAEAAAEAIKPSPAITNAIGFQVPSQTEYDEEEEEYE